MWDVELVERAALNEDVVAEQRALGLRSWAASPDTNERYPFGVTWASPTWLALIRNTDGRLIGRAGLLERTVLWGEETMRIGAVSSVSTDPDFWGRGVASAAVRRIMQFLRDDLHARAGLLFASQMGRPIYARLGWREVDAGVAVRCVQPGGELSWRDEFPDTLPMIWPCDDRPLPQGRLDVNGLPW